MNTPMVYILKAENEAERPAHAFWAEYIGVYEDHAGDQWVVVRGHDRDATVDLIDPGRVTFRGPKGAQSSTSKEDGMLGVIEAGPTRKLRLVTSD